ncbi:hypothetical protein ACFY71_40405 [Streptomyces cinerochromogenes]|uniref:hypothetical protein n=1 Tax=Streptomyces cinerochromogenes TaxID=66422 RepID=UPI0036858205
MYDGKLPIVVTGMKQLKEQGPAGAVFRRFGRPHNQTLLDAIGNPRREAHDARKQAEYAAREREYKEQLRRIAAQGKAEREARRPVCAGCGTRFSDERWKAIAPAGWDAPRDTHPHLCDDCKQRAITTERQAEQLGLALLRRCESVCRSGQRAPCSDEKRCRPVSRALGYLLRRRADLCVVLACGRSRRGGGLMVGRAGRGHDGLPGGGVEDLDRVIRR